MPNVKFLASADWKRAMTPAGVKRVNSTALTVALADFQNNAIPKRFTKGTPAKTRVTWRTLFNRAREALRTHKKLIGAPDLASYFQKHFGAWDPWSKFPPPIRLVRRRNAALLNAKAGGYATSRYDEWTRASKDYRAWAKTMTRKWLQSLVGSADFVPLVLSGELRAVAGTGKITVVGTKGRIKGTLTIPRAGRQNEQVIKVFGGAGREAVVMDSEMVRMQDVMTETIERELTGVTSALKTKKPRKSRKKAAT